MTYAYSLLETPVAGVPVGVQRSDGANIPANPENTDWQAYQTWLAAGNTPTPVPAPSLAALTAYAEAMQAKVLALRPNV